MGFGEGEQEEGTAELPCSSPARREQRGEGHSAELWKFCSPAGHLEPRALLCWLLRMGGGAFIEGHWTGSEGSWLWSEQ